MGSQGRLGRRRQDLQKNASRQLLRRPRRHRRPGPRRSTVYSRYEYQHPAKKHSTGGRPGDRFDPVRGASPSRPAASHCHILQHRLNFQGGGFVVGGDNVIRLTPLDRGGRGQQRDADDLRRGVPRTHRHVERARRARRPSGAANPKTTYKNGDKCPADARSTPARPARSSTPTGPRSAKTKPDPHDEPRHDQVREGPPPHAGL